MKEKLTHDTEGPPCRHMEPVLQRTADGSAGRFGRMYALAHTAGCPRCARFLRRLEETLDRLKGARKDPPEDAMERLMAGKWRDEA